METNETQAPQGKSRASIIERVKKLRQMTTERGASESEAMQAMALCEKLIAEFNIEQSELEIRADAKNCITDGLTSFRAKQEDWSKLAISIEKLYGTIAWMEWAEDDALDLGFPIKTISVKFYGFPLDVQGSITTLAICSTAIDTALAGLKRVGKGKKTSFELGMTQRLRERIKELRERRRGPVQAPGALVLLKEQLVKQEFINAGIDVGNCKRYNIADLPKDAAYYAAGKAAGDRVPLNEAVSGQSQRRIS